MFAVLISIHAIIAILLIAVILLQSGRSGGLTESFGAAAESIFGTKTNTVMVRSTAVLAILFIVSCLSLAYISKQQSRSLMERAVVGQKDEGIIQETPEETAVEKTVEKVQPVEGQVLEEEDTVGVSADEDISSEEALVPDATSNSQD